MESALHVLSFGALVVEVDAALGGRVTAFRLHGRNVLAEANAHPENFGSTFWTSPQSDWAWPPVVEIDSAPYVVAPAGGAALIMIGPRSERLGVHVEKRFVARPERRALEIDYCLRNAGPGEVRLAPWEVTRVHPGGLTFFPTGEGLYSPSNLTVTDAGGATWFAFDAARIAGHPKLFADAGAGWLAHVDGRTLFVKTFPRVPRVQQAAGEALIEIYAHPDRTYVELEQQGPLTTIAAGSACHWSVSWYLRALADDVEVAVGGPSLLAAVAAVLDGGG
ncbi:MAG TPA: hypothetical protein VH374_24905 [Polyangia bacterium]|nr:hypothetical protein [Polyangia bacterium]